MKTEDVIFAAVAAGVVLVAGLVWKKTVDARDNVAELSAGPYPSIALNKAVQPHGGSWFTPEAQAVWAVPDDQLPQWANL